MIFLLLIYVGSAVAFAIPALATSFTGYYTISYSPYNNASQIHPFFTGALAINAGPDYQAAYLQILSAEGAPFLFETAFTATVDQKGYQEAGDGRCWEIGQISDSFVIIFLGFLQIPSDATFQGFTMEQGYNCSSWTWPTQYGNGQALVRVTDSALLLLSNINYGFLLTFTDVVVATPDPSWFAPPFGPCFKQVSEKPIGTKSLISKKIQASNQPPPPKPPKLAQIWQADYIFGIPGAFNVTNLALLDGHVALNYNKRQLRALIQDSQENKMPFILQTVSLTRPDPKNVSNIQGFQFLGKGQCVESPQGLLAWILSLDFQIPSNAIFLHNTSCVLDNPNSPKCQVWGWQFNYQDLVLLTQSIAVDIRGAIWQFYIQIDLDIGISFPLLWENKNVILNKVDPSYFVPPIGCY